MSECGYLITQVNVVKPTPDICFVQINSGFNHLIRPMFYDAYHRIENISNPELVDWLQAQLASLDNSNDIIISGGRYTAAIAQQVRRFQQQQGLAADGILGRETLMRLAQLSGENIPLLREDA